MRWWLVTLFPVVILRQEGLGIDMAVEALLEFGNGLPVGIRRLLGISSPILNKYGLARTSVSLCSYVQV